MMKAPNVTLAKSALATAMGIFLLSACNGVATSPEALARESAKSVIRPVVAQRFPGLPTDMVVDCAIDNASLTEIGNLAQYAVTSDTANGTAAALQLLGKPATIQCVSEKALDSVLNL